MRIRNLIEGLNAQQRSVPQLPAQAHAKHISVLGAKTDPKHPFAGYMVGADESIDPSQRSQDDMPDLESIGEPVESIMDAERRMAAGDRIFAAHEMDEEPFEIFNVGDLAGYTYDQILAVPRDLEEVKLDEKCWDGYEKKGMKTMFGKRVPNCVKNEAAERSELDDPRVQAALKKMAERHKDEKWSKEQLAALGKRIAARGQKPVKEDITKEDIISKLKAKLGDYLSDVSKEIKKDPDLMDKLAAKAPGDQMGPPVKTITTDDGHEIQIHGNEDDGFRISIKNKPAASKFKNLDEAIMACEMYCARRRTRAQSADYADEA